MNSIKLDTKVQQHPDVLTADVDDAVMLLSIQNGAYFDMPNTGSHIWNAIETSKSVAQIVEGLLQVYDVDAEQCQRSVIGFLERLLDEGIVEIVDTEDPVQS